MAKKDKRERNKEIAVDILKAVGLTGFVLSCLVFPGFAVVAKLFEGETDFQGTRFRRSFHTLRRKGSIKLQKHPGGVKLVLTEKGKKQLEKMQMRSLSIAKPNTWDKKWRMVMFDVPEQMRWSRNQIRKILKRLGFEAIQKSVFIHPYPCEDVVDFLRTYYKLRSGELYIFEAKVLEGEKILLKHFKL